MPETSVQAVVDGIVGDVKVKVGDQVQEGDLVAVQVVTKTEFQVKAQASGRVKSVVNKGHKASQGEAIVVLE